MHSSYAVIFFFFQAKENIHNRRNTDISGQLVEKCFDLKQCIKQGYIKQIKSHKVYFSFHSLT